MVFWHSIGYRCTVCAKRTRMTSHDTVSLFVFFSAWSIPLDKAREDSLQSARKQNEPKTVGAKERAPKSMV